MTLLARFRAWFDPWPGIRTRTRALQALARINSKGTA